MFSSTDKKSSGVSSAGSNSAEEDARIKAEKIKIAIEKIKEASVKKLFIKVFTSDGSAKSLLVDEKMSVGQVNISMIIYNSTYSNTRTKYFRKVGRTIKRYLITILTKKDHTIILKLSREKKQPLLD